MKFLWFSFIKPQIKYLMCIILLFYYLSHTSWILLMILQVQEKKLKLRVTKK